MPLARALAAALLLVLVAATSGCDSAGTVVAAPSGARMPDAGPTDFFSRPVPPLGTLTVVDVGAETYERRLLAASLQGIVNRSRVRLYLIGTDGTPEETAAQRFWLARYASANGVAVGPTVGIDAALATFARETAGYVVASMDEPWTIEAATTLAGLDDVLLATASTSPKLDALGLPRKDDLRGRWPSNDACIRSTFATLYPRSNRTALGVLRPTYDRLLDFLVQNRLFTFYAEPFTDGWQAAKDVLAATPPDQPVIGYFAANGLEEVASVNVISASGKFLVPSDTAWDLSVHASVRADDAVQAPPPPGAPSAADCAKGTLRVAVAISDGDNVSLAMERYASDRYWLAPGRGTVPMGWSLGGSVLWLEPAIAAYYEATRGPRDELVTMIGIGYASPSRFPDPGPFLDRSFAAVERMGATTLWEIDPGMYDRSAPVWKPFSSGAIEHGLAGLLLGYFDDQLLSVGAPSFRTAQGVEVLATQSDYGDAPADIGKRIASAAAAMPGGGPDAVFLSASVWSNDWVGLAGVLSGPSATPGVTPMTPSQLLRCLAAGW